MTFAFLWLSMMVSRVHPCWAATILKYCLWVFDQFPDDRAFFTDNKDKPGERGFSGIFQKGQIVTALWGPALWGVLQEPGRTGVAWVRSEVTSFYDISKWSIRLTFMIPHCFQCLSWKGKCGFQSFETFGTMNELRRIVITHCTPYLQPTGARQGHPEGERGLVFFHFSDCGGIRKWGNARTELLKHWCIFYVSF